MPYVFVEARIIGRTGRNKQAGAGVTVPGASTSTKRKSFTVARVKIMRLDDKKTATQTPSEESMLNRHHPKAASIAAPAA
ncbi:MAG TPA: hypothetical protein VGM85_15550, partial [Paraburkholderia sp.]